MSTENIQLMAEASTTATTATHQVADWRIGEPNSMGLVKLPEGVADLERSEVRHNDGQRNELSDRETELLRYLAKNPDRPVSRDEILQQVWHLDPRRLITRTIDMHIANLRGKLHDDPGDPKVLVTVRGQGYMFTAKRCR